MLSEYSIRHQIIQVCQLLYQKNLLASTAGNVSVRLSKERILTTPSGFNKGRLNAEQLVITNLAGEVLSRGDLVPSSELKMHLMVYNERDDIKAVVHAHPPYATGFAAAGIPLSRCLLPEIIITLGSVPLASYATPSTEEVPESIKPYVHSHKAILLANHGVLTIGAELWEAYNYMEAVEHLAHITFLAKQVGKLNILSKEEVQKLLELRKKYGLQGIEATCTNCGMCNISKQEQPLSELEKLVEEIIQKFKDK